MNSRVPCCCCRLGAPEEFGATVMFLLSDEASDVTGAELVVDGGLIA